MKHPTRHWSEGYFVLAIVLAMTIAAVTCPGETEAQTLPKMLISAQTHDGRVTTDAYFYQLPGASSAATVQTQSCIEPSFTVAPGDALGNVKVLRNWINEWTCSVSPEFSLVPAPPNVESFVDVSFNEAVPFSFKVKPIGAISVGHPASVTPAVSDDVDVVIANVFPSEQVTVYLSLNGKEEACNATPPLTQCVLHIKGAGTLSVYLKPAPICNLCVDPKPVYGVVTNGRPNGGSLTAYPF